MSDRTRFKKLRLPSSQRNQEQPVISKFFSNNENNNNDSVNNDLEVVVSTPPESKKPKLQEKGFPEANRNACENLKDPEDPSRYRLEIHAFQECFADAKCKIPKSSTIKTFLKVESPPQSDFETPKKPIKKLEKPKKAQATKKRKAPSKQMKIKNAFMKSEEYLFTELVAKHSIAEDVDPEQMQLALALSRSVSQVSSELQEDDLSIQNSTTPKEKSEHVRAKLQAFGFKVNANHKDYDISVYSVGNKHYKWGNKFTPLTMRDPERQQRKVTKRVAQLIDESSRTAKELTDREQFQMPFQIASTYLLGAQPECRVACIQATDLEEDLDQFYRYYVPGLVEPSKLKGGYLLKSFANIPGRERTPERKNPVRVHVESPEMEEIKSISIKERSMEDVVDLHTQSMLLETGEKLAESCESGEPSIEKNCDKKVSSEEFLSLENASSSNTRCRSPDLFSESDNESFIDCTKKTDSTSIYVTADSSKNPQHPPDVEAAAVAPSEEKNQSTIYSFEESQIDTFERFSSDEGFAINDTNHENQSIIDITQDSDEEESEDFGKQLINDCQKSISIKENGDKLAGVDSEELDVTIKPLREMEENKNHKIDRSSLKFTTSSEDVSDFIFKTPTKFSPRRSDISPSLLFTGSPLKFDLSHKSPNSRAKKSINFCKEIPKKSETSVESFDQENRNSFDLSQESVASDLIVLSDDEVNYSIKIADGTLRKHESMESIDLTQSPPHEADIQDSPPNSRQSGFNFGSQLNFDNVEGDFNSDAIYQSENNTEEEQDILPDDTCFDLGRLRARFGLQENSKKSTFDYNYQADSFRKAQSDSFLTPNLSVHTTQNFKRFSSSRKFSQFLEDDDVDFSDIDEIDRLVYKNSQTVRAATQAAPSGMETLLTGAITAEEYVEPERFVKNDQVYLIQTKNVRPMPDYKRMDSPTRLKELYKHGLKPLSKKKAIIMLEYIYNQTHPFVESKSDIDEDNIEIERNSFGREKEDSLIKPMLKEPIKDGVFNLSDVPGKKLLECSELKPELKSEEFIFQTNVRSKIPTCLLPLHLAWFNLIKSNDKLFEAVLYYEPIDLQEIYIFFKSIGYRYEPKDMKRFFDKRGIIFRYDLSDGTSNRHVRKTKIGASQKRNNR